MRKLSFFFFLVMSVFALSFSSLADLASGSNASRVWEDFSNNLDEISNDFAIADDDIVLSSEDSIALASDDGNLPIFDSTVDLSKASVLVYYYDVYKKLHSVSSNVGVDGWFNLDRPDDYASISSVIYRFPRFCLPSSGKYNLQFRSSVQAGGSGAFIKSTLYFEKTVSNATPVSQVLTVAGSYYYADSYVSHSLDLSTSYNFLNVQFFYDPDLTFYWNFDGAISLRFDTLSSSATTDSTVDAGNDIDDTANNTADIAYNSATQVEQGDTIIELIKNTIETISNQLTAFWNQLAGEFTNLYTKMNEQHAEDLAKVDEQISADRDNTEDLINNQDKNTQQLIGGYDSSGLDSDSNKLNDSLTGLEDKENAIHDQASGWITDFTLPSFDQLLESGGILAACLWLGQFWQSMFTNMGAFNIPVTLSLCLIFVLMLVGYHRFKR